MPSRDATPVLWAPRRLHRRPLLTDIVAALLTVVLPTLVLAFGDRPGRHGLRAGDIVAAAVFVPLLFLRRHAPKRTVAIGAVVGAAITAVSGERSVAFAAMVVLLFTMADRNVRPTALAVGAASTSVLFAAAATRLDDKWFAPDSFAVVAWSFMALAAGDAVRSRREYINAIEERARRAEETRESEAQRRVIDERLRIARELHDVVAHHMAVITVQAGVASHLLRSNPDGADQALSTVRNAGRSVLDELSGLLSVLRSSDDVVAPADPMPTLRELDELIASFTDAGLRVDYRTTGAATSVSEAVQLTVYRVVEEALTNAQKYGDGRAAVHIEREPDAIEVRVENQIDHDKVAVGARSTSGGHGLIGMRERVVAMAGTIELESTNNDRFVVHAHVPAHRGELA
jgi:signal transduction histidine kinase